MTAAAFQLFRVPVEFDSTGPQCLQDRRAPIAERKITFANPLSSLQLPHRDSVFHLHRLSSRSILIPGFLVIRKLAKTGNPAVYDGLGLNCGLPVASYR